MATRWTQAQMPSQAGRTFLVTGANSGIGYQAALAFAGNGARVLMGCRSRSKGTEALERLQREIPTAQAEVVDLDVASLHSIRTFAKAYVASGEPLHVLVNNAGVMALPDRQLTEDGFERQFGTNHLGHFALTGLLLPALRKVEMSRVVTVASLAHRNGRMDWDNLQSERDYVPWNAYNASKLANILFAKELNRRAHKAGVPLVSVAVHPGISRTSIFENGPGTAGLKAKIIQTLAPVLTQDDKMGALPTEYAATSSAVKGGEYIGPDGFGELKGYPRVVTPRPQALDEAAGERLWQVSEQLTGITYLQS